MNKRVEILAPAGGQEQLIAAVRSGADAVYLGTKSFNARAGAQNFGEDDLLPAISYCRERGVRVYVTLNTLVFDDELGSLRNEIELLAKCGVDAVIVQDLAAAAFIRECCPGLPLHASTQMTVHNLDGAKALEEMGFKRVVLARELTFDEIGIIARGTGLELEVFIHGALCMSVSGTCYISSMLGGRSGNRGRCAQPCRLDFKLADRGYALSLKDLSAIEHINKLSSLGVSAFKIEGRMKRPEYVAAAVDACIRARKNENYDAGLLRSVFSRGGFTDGYLTGKRDSAMFGYRKKEDVLASAGVLSSIRELYRRERQSAPVSIKMEINADLGVRLSATDGVNSVSCYDECARVPENALLSMELAEKSVAKMGGTPYYLKEFELFNEHSLFVFPAEINRLRREALRLLSLERSRLKSHDYLKKEYKASSRAISGNKALRFRFQSFDQFFDTDGIEKIIMPVDEISAHSHLISELGGKLVAELPELFFHLDEQKLRETMMRLKALGLKNALTDNIGGVYLLKELGLNIFGGYGLNIVNTVALCEYDKLGVHDISLSFETPACAIAALGGSARRGIIGYGKLPLMKFRNCPARGTDGCRECGGVTRIRDRMSIDFPLLCRSSRYTVLLNSVPLYIGNKTIDNIDFETLYFTDETKDEVKEIFSSYISKSPPTFKCTNGLYFRNI